MSDELQTFFPKPTHPTSCHSLLILSHSSPVASLIPPGLLSWSQFGPSRSSRQHWPYQSPHHQAWCCLNRTPRRLSSPNLVSALKASTRRSSSPSERRPTWPSDNTPPGQKPHCGTLARPTRGRLSKASTGIPGSIGDGQTTLWDTSSESHQSWTIRSIG